MEQNKGNIKVFKILKEAEGDMKKEFFEQIKFRRINSMDDISKLSPFRKFTGTSRFHSVTTNTPLYENFQIIGRSEFACVDSS
jgi:hypothetical protein